MASSQICAKIRSGRKRVCVGSKRSQSLIEFSLVMPILLITVTGMLSFGIAMHTNGVNTAVQLFAMNRGQTAVRCATAYTSIQSAAPSLTRANLSFTFVIDGTTTSCTAGAANMVQGAIAQLKVTYPCAMAIYSLPIPSCNLAAQTAEVIQ